MYQFFVYRASKLKSCVRHVWEIKCDVCFSELFKFRMILAVNLLLTFDLNTNLKNHRRSPKLRYELKICGKIYSTLGKIFLFTKASRSNVRRDVKVSSLKVSYFDPNHVTNNK